MLHLSIKDYRETYGLFCFLKECQMFKAMRQYDGYCAENEKKVVIMGQFLILKNIFE